MYERVVEDVVPADSRLIVATGHMADDGARLVDQPGLRSDERDLRMSAQILDLPFEPSRARDVVLIQARNERSPRLREPDIQRRRQAARPFVSDHPDTRVVHA